MTHEETHNRPQSLQLSIGALFFAVLLPSALWYVGINWLKLDLNTDPLINTALGCSIAALTASIWFRNLTRFPGITGAGYIIPSLAAPYGLLVLILLLGRIDYSRVLVASSVAICLVWFFIYYLQRQRSRNIEFGYIDGGGIEKLTALDGISWQKIETIADVKPAMRAVTIDFASDVSDEWERALSHLVLQGVPVYDFKELVESLSGKVEIDHPSENKFGGLAPLAPYFKMRMVFDRVTALLTLIALLPVFVIVGILIRLETPGPIFFRQERVGYRGRPFLVCKFRTMRHEADRPTDRSGSITSANDVRITRVGQFLRRSRIDELPQVWNILKGEMGWIGPRPEALPLSKWYENEIPFYLYRHVVPPGVTGWAQVRQGHVADLEGVTEKLAYDFYYIKNFSFWLDLLIVFMTIRTMFTGYGHK